MGNIITSVKVTAHFVRSTLLETASAESWVGDLLNMFWKPESFFFLFKAATLPRASEIDTVLNLERIHIQYSMVRFVDSNRCLHPCEKLKRMRLYVPAVDHSNQLSHRRAASIKEAIPL